MAVRRDPPEFPTGRAAIAAARAQAGAKRAAAGKAAAREAAEAAAAGPRPPRGGRPAVPARFAAFAADVVLRHDDIDEGEVFDRPCLRVRGRAFAVAEGDGVALKLPRSRYDELRTVPGMAPFEPSGRDRATGTWLLVPGPHRQRWRALADEAIAFVARGG